ncbi:MAG: outer membrane beta-barrel protein [Emcibacteraceae bacterium]
MNNRIFAALVVTTALCGWVPLAYSDEEPVTDSAIVIYDKAYFETFSPVTLLDMLKAVPGVPEILNANEEQIRQARRSGGAAQRGFGSGGDQILMDGKRLAGKSNNITDTLTRFSASQVDHIELIRGAVSGLDVQSQGLVVNIVMAESGSTSTTFWQVRGEYTEYNKFYPEFLVSHSGSLDKLDYTFSYERKNKDTHLDIDEEFFDPQDNYKALQIVKSGTRNFAHSFNSNLAYEFEDGGRLRLNGLFEPGGQDGLETRDKTSDTLRPLAWVTTRDSDKWEIGGDYTRPLGMLGNLKSLFVINRNAEDYLVDRFKGSGTEKYEYTKDDTSLDQREKIFRGSISKDITKEQNLELGGEAAFNKFNKTFDSFTRSSAASSYMLSTSDNVKIKENRYEIFAVHSFNISPEMVLQSSLTTEFSKIVADNILVGGAIDRRDTSFTYLKPRFNFRYDVTNLDQIRLLVEKKVSQLDFNNFVTRFDQMEQIFKPGNTKIRPEQTWDFSFTYEHRLPDDGGSLEAEIFYRKYTDHISAVDFTNYVDFNHNPITADEFFTLPPDTALRDYVGDTGEGYSAKQGNIPKARSFGAKIKSNLRLGFIGLPNATFSVNYTVEKRKTTDQFTGLERSFHLLPDQTWAVNFRHDIPDYQFTYGLELTSRSDYKRYYINYFWPNSPAASYKVFAEKTVFNDYKIRLEAEGLRHSRGTSTVFYYYDHIRFDDLYERKVQHWKRLTQLRFSIQGTF